MQTPREEQSSTLRLPVWQRNPQKDRPGGLSHLSFPKAFFGRKTHSCDAFLLRDVTNRSD